MPNNPTSLVAVCLIVVSQIDAQHVQFRVATTEDPQPILGWQDFLLKNLAQLVLSKDWVAVAMQTRWDSRKAQYWIRRGRSLALHPDAVHAWTSADLDQELANAKTFGSAPDVAQEPA